VTMPRQSRSIARALVVTAALVAAILTLVTSSQTSAHARLKASDPAPSSALAVAPAEIRLTFTEPIDAQFSSASLLSADGQTIPVGPVQAAENDTAVISISDPSVVPAGNYTLVWHVLSAADGHYTDGLLSFSVGTGQAPSAASTTNTEEPIPWWAIAANWLEVMGLIAVCGFFAFGLFVAVVALRLDPIFALRQTMRLVWWISFAVAIAGMLGVLVVQIGRATDGSTLGWPGFDNARNMLFDTRFGQCWIVRFLLLVALVFPAAATIGWPRSSPGRQTQSSGSPWWCGAVLGAVILLTLPLSGHAVAADLAWVAVANDWIHLVAVAVWLGGLVYLVPSIFVLSRDERAAAILAAASIARNFSRTALVALLMVIASGFVNALFDVSGPTNLTTEEYGRTMIVKHLIVIPILIAAGANLLVTVPRIKQAVAQGHVQAMRHFLRALRLTVVFELVTAVVVIVAAVALTELAPADGPLQVNVAARTASFDQHGPAGGLDVWLLGRITGEPSDRFTLTVTDTAGSAPDDLLRVIVESSAVTSSGSVTDRFGAEPLSGTPGAYTFPASRLGLSADWNLDVIVRRAGIPDETANFAVDTQGAGLQSPRFVSDEWRFPRMTLVSWLTLALAIAVVIGGVIGVRKLPGLEPLAAALLLTMTALITAGFLVTSYRMSIPVSASTNLENPIPADDASIKRGEDLYVVQCLTCHGATGGGPNEATVADDPSHNHGVNADLLTSRVSQQRDGDLYDSITDGVPGTDMPAFEVALEDQARWDLVNFLRKLQKAE
jgi:copper transport protein